LSLRSTLRMLVPSLQNISVAEAWTMALTEMWR
jgi:hypothetical protein